MYIFQEVCAFNSTPTKNIGPNSILTIWQTQNPFKNKHGPQENWNEKHTIPNSQAKWKRSWSKIEWENTLHYFFFFSNFKRKFNTHFCFHYSLFLFAHNFPPLTLTLC